MNANNQNIYSMPEDTLGAEVLSDNHQLKPNPHPNSKWQSELQVKPNVAEYIINSPRPIFNA